MNIDHLVQNLPTCPFRFKEAKDLGFSQRALKEACDQGKIDKLRHGYYRKCRQKESFTDEDVFSKVTFYLGSPSAICLMSALWFYDLSDEIPHQTWVLVPDNKRMSDKDIRLLRSRDPLWDVGIIKKKSYWITSPERTIIDSLKYQHIIGRNIGIQALKAYVGIDKKLLNDIYYVAEQMNYVAKIRPYLEMISI